MFFFNRSPPRPEPRLIDPDGGQVLVLVPFIVPGVPGKRNQFTVLVLVLLPFTVLDVPGDKKKNKAPHLRRLDLRDVGGAITGRNSTPADPISSLLLS